MQTNKILSASLIDLIFDGRNKEYGAYYLRKTYEQRIKKAMIVTFSIAVLIIGGTALAGVSKQSETVYRINDGVILTDIPPEEKIIEPPPKADPPPEEVQVQTEKLTDMVIVNKEVIEPPPSQESLAVAIIGLEKTPGIEATGIVSQEISNGVEKGIVQEKINKEPEGPLEIVQVEAAFIGDWVKFLKRNLDPETPIRNNAPPGRYTVVVQFIVDKEGNVSDIKTLTNHGYGLEAEAIRVLRKAPKWEPAIQNGYKVKAYRKQMITFEVQDDF